MADVITGLTDDDIDTTWRSTDATPEADDDATDTGDADQGDADPAGGGDADTGDEA